MDNAITNDELGEALVTAGSQTALLDKVVSPIINDIIRRRAPLVAMIPNGHHPHDQFYWNTRNALPAGSAVEDGGTVVLGNGGYIQSTVQMRHMIALGAITGYTEEVTAAMIGSLRRKEMEGTARGLLWDLESQIVWGCDGATNLGPGAQFNGFDATINQFSGPLQNSIDWGGNDFSQGMLDQAIDLVESNISGDVSGDEYMWVCSGTAVSREVQIQQALQRNVDMTVVRAGLEVPSYRGIPFAKTSFLSSRGGQMTTVTPSTATTGGTLAAGTYYYTVVPRIWRYGVLSPAATVSQAVTGSTSVVNLAFPTPQVNLPQGSTNPMSYEVYRGTSGSNMKLIGVVDAIVGKQGDNKTRIYANGIQDTGSNLVPTFNVTTTPTSTPATYQGAQDRGPRVAGGEDIMLVPRSEDLIFRPWVRQWKPLDLYPTVDTPDAMPYGFIYDGTLAFRSAQDFGRIRNVKPTLAA